MPIVAIIDGVRIIMFFFKDHDPPHFHVEYAEYRAKVSIATLKVIEGRLPPGKRRRVIEWQRKIRMRCRPRGRMSGPNANQGESNDGLAKIALC